MRPAAALGVCAVLAGCAAAPTQSPSSTAPESNAAQAASATPSASRSAAEDLVAYLGRLRTMNEAALANEAARVRREPGDLARVKAALALALAPQSEETEIMELAEPAMRRGDRDVRAMAAFVHSLASERRRLKQAAASANGQLREEKRNVESQKQRAEALQQKLDALTEVERSLAERQATPR